MLKIDTSLSGKLDELFEYMRTALHGNVILPPMEDLNYQISIITMEFEKLSLLYISLRSTAGDSQQDVYGFLKSNSSSLTRWEWNTYIFRRVSDVDDPIGLSGRFIAHPDGPLVEFQEALKLLVGRLVHGHI